MRSLADLLASPGGRDFLRGRGVLTDPAEFLARLRPTASDGARPWLDSSSDAPPVYAGQQLQCDYPRPVAAKFEALRDLARSGDVTPVAVWLDTDRAGASKASTTLTWPGDGEQSSQRLVPQRFDDLEVRFVPTERKRLDAAAARLGAWTEAAAGDAGLSERSRARLRELVAELLRDDVHTLAQTNLAISTWLLRELGFEPCPVRVSDLAECGVLAVAVDDVVARIDDFVAAFNAAVEELRARDVDPQVPPLDPRYLPLRYSCPRDGWLPAAAARSTASTWAARHSRSTNWRRRGAGAWT
jgi:hypothetical protein